MSALSIDRIEVLADRVRLCVSLDADAPRKTTRRMVDHALCSYPDLPSHVCVNGKGPTFGAVMYDTSVLHLYEHLIISEHAKDVRVPEKLPLIGTSQWTDSRLGTGKIELSFHDDIVILGAAKRALEFMNRLLAQEL
ncbi:MAG: hypothetical protein LUB61_01760 [Eggerthellaceae bacterium]|nr:hypothetical protein [Eggerthellaceae bacterium]